MMLFEELDLEPDEKINYYILLGVSRWGEKL